MSEKDLKRELGKKLKKIKEPLKTITIEKIINNINKKNVKEAFLASFFLLKRRQ